VVLRRTYDPSVLTTTVSTLEDFQMPRWTTLRVLLLALFIAVSGCANCTDGTPGNNNNSNNRQEPETEVPQGSRLLHVPDQSEDSCSATQPTCAKNVTYSSQIPLKAQLVDGDDNPIDNTTINFELDAGMAEGTTLEAASAVSDGEGIAETALRAGNTAGTVEVTVTAGGENSEVEPIQFVVAVNSKGASSYIVTFNHNGASDLKDIKVRAFESDTSCDAVAEDHARETTAGVNPTLTAVTQGQGIAGADGTLPQVVIPNVMNGTAYTIEARGFSRSNDEVEAAFGCKDMNPAVENGMSVTVEVDLIDNLPRIAGAYDVTHEFSIQDTVCAQDMNGDYMGVLPSGVCLAIDLIGRLATDPGSFLVGDENNDGLLQILVGFLPDGSGLKDTIESFINNEFIQDLAGNVINDFAQDWINNNAPDWVKGAVNITGDLYESLQEFKVNGTMRIGWEPTPQYDMQSGTVIGILEPNMDGEDPGKQVWSEIVVFWTGDCDPDSQNFDACRERTLSANDVGTDDVVEGYFTGSLLPIEDDDDSGYGLQIDEHTLTLNYGVFLLGVLEKIVLPSVFNDQSVTSVNDALEKMIEGIFSGQDGDTSCEQFGSWVDDSVGGGANIATSLCDNLLQQASDAIREYMTDNLTVSGEDNFLIGTPDGEPCRLYEPDQYAGEWNGKPLPYVEAMGDNKPELKCKWDLKIKYGGDPEDVVETDGTFWGTRSGF
jgi:hypothetical protein